jgi:hypothetical protein
MAESRAALEVEHADLLARLHRRSSDFDASTRLRVVIAELQRLPYPRAGPGTGSGTRNGGPTAED